MPLFAAGEDYDFANGTLSFTSSEGTAGYSVDILQDELTEGQEMFAVSLSGFRISLGGMFITLVAQEGGRLSLQPDSASVTIEDDDRKYLCRTDVKLKYG